MINHTCVQRAGGDKLYTKYRAILDNGDSDEEGFGLVLGRRGKALLHSDENWGGREEDSEEEDLSLSELMKFLMHSVAIET